MTNERKPKKKKLDAVWLLAILVPAIFLFSAYQFLHTTNGYEDSELTGIDVIDQLPHFWVGVWFGILGTIVFLGLAILNETGIWIGKYLRGYMIWNILFILLAMACLVIPWLRALAIKANEGIDLPKTNNSKPYEHITPGGTYSSTAGNTCSYITHGLPVKG